MFHGFRGASINMHAYTWMVVYRFLRFVMWLLLFTVYAHSLNCTPFTPVSISIAIACARVRALPHRQSHFLFFAESQKLSVKFHHWRDWNIVALMREEIARTIVKITPTTTAATAPAAAYKGKLSVVKNPRAHVRSFACLLTQALLCSALSAHIFSYWSRLHTVCFECISSIRFVWTSIYANAF